MKSQNLTGNEIRQTFIDFFIEKAGHSFVRSSSLVPGGDATLLFTNAGMVQFKDIFLGTEKPPYSRAVNSQKCLRVAGKHNDLEDVGQDNSHHTFFEMLGNWSFGDYYKKEAIAWAWELLTEIWGIPKELLYVTVFEDDLGEIPSDEEAAELWRQQPGFNQQHIFYLGRKDNFWEMADTGPCGPCSEIHIDLRPGDGPVTNETFDTDRLLEFWNLVFIQYNCIGPSQLEPLPTLHIDTGLGFERIVNILQNVGSNYRTDLFWPLIEATAELTGHTEDDINTFFTPYRVIADHARAATFLIADGVVPGNVGRNYICRMIIRRGFRFGGKIGLTEPFLSHIAEIVIHNFGEAYPELVRNKKTILDTILREEEQFQRTLDKAITYLENLINEIEDKGLDILTGEQAADLYTTYGMPFEIARDIVQERGICVDEDGFATSMDAHRRASGAGNAMGSLGGENVEIYRQLFEKLKSDGKLGEEGVRYHPYEKPDALEITSELLALLADSQTAISVRPGDTVEVIIPETKFYVESGGQVADTGTISADGWEIQVTNIRKPAAGIITHVGTVSFGVPTIGDQVIAKVDGQRRKDIMRNHTATHLLHSALHQVLGDHARQAGSLVAPDRLRFDFTHPEPLTQNEIERIEELVNEKIFRDQEIQITHKSLDAALKEGAIALFGERYDEKVRNITIGEGIPFSNELCGGTHVESTGDLGIFIITNESSAAAGIRRIEAISGREAYTLVQHRFGLLNQVAACLSTSSNQLLEKTQNLISDTKKMRNQISQLRQNLALVDFTREMDNTSNINGVDVLTVKLTDVDVDGLRQMADQFRKRYPTNGIALLASVINAKPVIIAAVTQDLVSRGIKAGNLAGFVARQMGGGGGGKPTLAQAGGKDAGKLDEALNSVIPWVEKQLK